LTIFLRGVLCNWMVSMGVVGAMISTSVSGKVIAMWMPIMLFFFMGFEHSVVNMFLFPSAMIMGGDFSLMDYLVWNETHRTGQPGGRPGLHWPDAVRHPHPYGREESHQRNNLLKRQRRQAASVAACLTSYPGQKRGFACLLLTRTSFTFQNGVMAYRPTLDFPDKLLRNYLQ
jgi:hypothetical protein